MKYERGTRRGEGVSEGVDDFRLKSLAVVVTGKVLVVSGRLVVSVT